MTVETFSTIMRAMAACGCSPEQMASVARTIEADEKKVTDKRREAARDRKQRQRSKSNDGHAVSRNVTRDRRDISLAPLPPLPPVDKESPPIPPKEINPPLSPQPRATPEEPSSRKSTPAEELNRVLDEEHATGVIEHLKSLKRPLTPYRAQYLARQFEQTPDPNAAADMMIGRGWQGFDCRWTSTRSETQFPRTPPNTKSDFKQRHDAAIAACDQTCGRFENDQQLANRASHIDLGPRDFHRR